MQMNWANIKIIAAVFAFSFCAALALAASKDATRGREVFEKRCIGCHALDLDKVGPRLRGVYGRQAGKIAGFGYSEEVKNASVSWNDATLESWLTDTESVIPG